MSELIAFPARGPLAAQRFTVGLVNNMPDAAMNAAERQFTSLIQAAAPQIDVRVRLYHLPGVERGEAARAQMAGRYDDIAEASDAGLDALIVTGAEPRAADLRAEPFWPEFERLAQWTVRTSLPTLWSCLAAHAAVLALDGVQRRRLPAKRAGVAAWERIGDDAAFAGLPARGLTPHSRYNDLAEQDLAAAGYRILARSADAGVDMFAGPRETPFLFLQGHPEYDADTPLREFRRDLSRWAHGEGGPPAVPRGYFPATVEARLLGRIARVQGSPGAHSARAIAALLESFTPTARWSDTALEVFGAFVGVSEAARSETSQRGVNASYQV